MEQIQVELQEVLGNDRVIAEAAWTSSYTTAKKELKTDADVERVVRMLGSSKPAHGVPFESVVFRFWIRLPISSDRQFMTHRIQSANGMSGRYRTMPTECFGLPEDVYEIWEEAEINESTDSYYALVAGANDWYKRICTKFKSAYEAGKIDNNQYKRAREIVRNVLLQGNMTERTTTMNLRSFANFQKQRNSPHAAPEMQLIAGAMLDAVKESETIPVALAVLEENGWVV